jgi:hypothetical protein
MIVSTRLYFLLSWLAIFLVVLSTGTAKGGFEQPPLDEKKIDELIRNLGDEDFQTRESATKQLLDLPRSVAKLRRMVHSQDREIARRAGEILLHFATNDDKKARGRLEKLLKNGELDEAIELLTGRAGWKDEAQAWNYVTRAMEEFVKKSEKEFGTPMVPSRNAIVPIPLGDFDTFAKATKKVEFLKTRRLEAASDEGRPGAVVRSDDLEVSLTGGSCLLAASRSLRSRFEVFDSVLLVGGNAKIARQRSSVVVCDGDLEIQSASDCLILAHGDVHAVSLNNCRVITTKKLVKAIEGSKFPDTKVKENQATPLSFIKWFDPKKVGIVVEAVEDGFPRVKEVVGDSYFAKAGIKAGDQILALDVDKITSTDIFRRQLRARVIEDTDILVRVRRDKKELDLLVHFRVED